MQYHPSHYKAENYQELVQAVRQEWQPYIKSDGESLLSSVVAQLLIKNNILVSEYEELKKGYFDLCKANDEMKRALLDIATEQKRINKLYSTKINKIQKKLLIKKAVMGVSAYSNKLPIYSLTYSSVSLNKCPAFIEENKKKIEVWVWDERIRIAKAHPLAWFIQSTIQSMIDTRNLIAAGGLRK